MGNFREKCDSNSRRGRLRFAVGWKLIDRVTWVSYFLGIQAAVNIGSLDLTMI